ncbi:MAG: hypothetical protein MJ121_00480 [Clostridia bacterium]|nr:hypothetical protein [Clostridia bacterium]
MDNMVTVLVNEIMLSHYATSVIALAVLVVSLIAAASFLAYRAVKKRREEEKNNAE